MATNNEETLIHISKWQFINWQNWKGGQGRWLYEFLMQWIFIMQNKLQWEKFINWMFIKGRVHSYALHYWTFIFLIILRPCWLKISEHNWMNGDEISPDPSSNINTLNNIRHVQLKATESHSRIPMCEPIQEFLELQPQTLYYRLLHINIWDEHAVFEGILK
jgi:hypothetical protein